MLQISTDKPLILPFVLTPDPGDPDPPGGTGDPPPPGIKPPTNQQQGNVGGGSGIKPPMAGDAEPPDAEPPDAEPPDAEPPDAEPPDTADDADPPIIVQGGNS